MMVGKRKIPKGLATKALCFLNYEGRADSQLLARQFGMTEGAMQRVLDKLEDRGLIKLGMMGRRNQDYYLRDRGYRAATPARCKPFMPFPKVQVYEAYTNRRLR